jgi:hypothetical protein
MEEPEYTRIEYSRPKAMFGAFYALILLVGITGAGTADWLFIVNWIVNLLAD